MSDSRKSSDDLRYRGALLVVISGLTVIGTLPLMLRSDDRWETSDIIALIGTLTTFLGTVVGAFLGVQSESSGKQQAEDLAIRALRALPPSEVAKILGKE
jgi:hypothetical protein